MHSERRTSYRIALRGSLALATHPSTGDSGVVKVLNSAGGALVAAGITHRRTSDLALHFRLGDHGAFDADVALLGPAAKAEGEGLVAFRFQSLGGDALGLLSSFLCSEHAQSVNRLERLFSSRDATFEIAGGVPGRNPPPGTASSFLLRHHLNDRRTPVFSYDETSGVTLPMGRVQVIDRGGQEVLLANGPAAATLDEREEYLLFFADTLAVTWFRSRIVGQRPGEVLFAMPTSLTRGGFRCSRRVSPPWSYPVTASIENPHLFGQVIARPLWEVAGSGFSIELDPVTDRLFPGQQLRRVCLDLPSGSVEMQCVLRMCRPSTAAGKMVAGFEIAGFRSPHDHDRWMRALIPGLFPQARIGDRELVSSAWDRLESSGYLELIDRSERVRLRKPFFDDWTRQAAHPSLRARFVLSYGNGTPIGVTATNLVYPKTCLVHSGGIDKAAQASGHVLGLYSAAFLFAHSMGEYCLSLFDAQKRTNATLFQRFIQHYSTPADNVFDGLTVFRWHASQAVDSLWQSRAAHGLEVVSANGNLMRVLWEHQQRTLSPLELDAYGWSPDGSSMQQFSERCAADGYVRGRQVFFALRDRVPLAALVVEMGSEGMNVFSLLNTCTIVFLRCPDENREQVVRCLLARAIDCYSGAGKEAFLLLASTVHERQARLHELGFTYVAEGWRWIASRRVIPAYITYLHDLATLRTVRAPDESVATMAHLDTSPQPHVFMI